jgi:hypothetical protein
MVTLLEACAALRHARYIVADRPHYTPPVPTTAHVPCGFRDVSTEHKQAIDRVRRRNAYAARTGRLAGWNLTMHDAVRDALADRAHVCHTL